MGEASKAGSRLRWAMLGVLFTARTVTGFQFQSVGSAAPALVDDLHLDHAGIGTLIGLYHLPGILAAIPCSLLDHRLGRRVTCAAGLVLMAAGSLAMAAASGFAAASAARLASGVGAVAFGQGLTLMAADWFAGRELVFAMGVFLSSWPLGIAAGLVLQGDWVRAFGWRPTMAITGLLCAAALLLIGLVYRPPPHGTAAPLRQPGPAPGGARLDLPLVAAVSLAGLIWASLNLGLVMFFSFAPGLLTGRGVAAGRADLMASLALWVLIPALPVGGLLVQRSGRPDRALLLASLAAGVALLLLAWTGQPAWGLLLGLAVGPAAGPIMALPMRVLDPARRALGLGLSMTCYYALLALGPAAGGWLQDRWRDPGVAVVMGGTCFLAILPMFALFRALERRRPAPC
jgi:predicted MFS family arabinose efflux permease